MSSQFTVAGNSGEYLSDAYMYLQIKQFTVSSLTIDNIISALNKALVLKMYK